MCCVECGVCVAGCCSGKCMYGEVRTLACGYVCGGVSVVRACVLVCGAKWYLCVTDT